MRIQSIPMWVGSSNNYAYLVSDEASKEAVIIDPANPAEVAPAIQEQIDAGKINNLSAIINTHHHWDHAGGNEEMLQRFPSTGGTVIGGKDCAGVTQTPAHNTRFFPLGGSSSDNNNNKISATALHTPCHTQDSICYYFEDGSTSPPQRAVFTGDTLFIGGCGKFFEGTAAQMHAALNEVLAALPHDTAVYPGHEYTKANVRFAASVVGADSKDSEAAVAVAELGRFADANRETQGRFTIADEKRHNVFMRVGTQEMRRVTGREAPAEVLARLREMKNNM